MNSYQTNIIWLGLILVLLNIVVNATEFKAVIFNKGTATTAQKTTAPTHPQQTTPTSVTV